MQGMKNVGTKYTTRFKYTTVQYSTVQYSTVQYSTVQYSTVQYTQIHVLGNLLRTFANTHTYDRPGC